MPSSRTGSALRNFPVFRDRTRWPKTCASSSTRRGRATRRSTMCCFMARQGWERRRFPISWPMRWAASSRRRAAHPSKKAAIWPLCCLRWKQGMCCSSTRSTGSPVRWRRCCIRRWRITASISWSARTARRCAASVWICRPSRWWAPPRARAISARRSETASASSRSWSITRWMSWRRSSAALQG